MTADTKPSASAPWERAARWRPRCRRIVARLLIALGLLGFPHAHGAEGVVDKIPADRTAPRCVGGDPPDRCVVLGEPVQCQGFGPLDPYAIWADVGSSRRVEAFLVAEHEKLGRDVARFARWLACQGFEVTVFDHGSIRRLSIDEYQLDATFSLRERERLFYTGLISYILFSPYSHRFELKFSSSDELLSVENGLNSK